QKLNDKKFLFYNQHDDVVLIPIGVIVNGKQYEFPDAEPLGLSKGFVSSWNALIINVLAPYNNIRIGTDVLIVGYPSSIGLLNKPQYDYYKPLLRKGIVAGVYPHQRTFIIDSPVFGGNSGGPVLQKSNG